MEDADEERDVEEGEQGGFDNPWAEEPPAEQDWAPKGNATSNPFADFQMHDNPLAEGGQVCTCICTECQAPSATP